MEMSDLDRNLAVHAAASLPTINNFVLFYLMINYQ